MRRGRFFTGALAVVAAALVWIPGGVAGSNGGTPEDIARDLSDGVLNGSYSKSQLERYLRDATQQVYPGTTTTTTTTGSTTIKTTDSTTTATTNSPPPSTNNNLPTGQGEVQGTNKEAGGNQPLAIKPAKPLAATKTRGHLPFTGAQLGLFAIVGLALLAMGFLLRSTARKPTEASS
jgi:hypothetical protein